MLGEIFIIIGVAFLMLRIGLYKVSGNPFDENPDKATKNLPQMILLLLLAETFVIFGIFLVDSPFPTVITTSYPAYNVLTANVPLYCSGAVALTQCGTTTEIQQNPAYNVTSISLTSPSEPSWQPLFPWIAGYIFTLVVVLLMFVDGLNMFRSSANQAFKLQK